MDRFSLAQIGFNLVFLVNIFYLHRRLAALRRVPYGAGVDLVERAPGAFDAEIENDLGAAGPAPRAGLESAPAAAPEALSPGRRLSWRERRAAARALRSGSLLTLRGAASPRGVESEGQSALAALSAVDARASRRAPRDGGAEAVVPPVAARVASLDDLIAAAERAESGAALQARFHRESPEQAQSARRHNQSGAVEVAPGLAPSSLVPSPGLDRLDRNDGAETRQGGTRSDSPGRAATAWPEGTRAADSPAEPVRSALGSLTPTTSTALSQRMSAAATCQAEKSGGAKVPRLFSVRL